MAIFNKKNFLYKSKNEMKMRKQKNGLRFIRTKKIGFR